MDTRDLKLLLAELRAKALSTRSVDQALGIASIYGHLLRINQIGILGDDEFEDRLAAGFDSFVAGLPPYTGGQGRGLFHIVTETFDYGGHTPLLQNCLQASKDGDDAHVAVVQSTTDRFVRSVAEADASLEVLTGSLSAKLAKLVQLGRRHKVVVLHISPEDIVSAIAARILRREGVRVLFVNHADHVFSFGRFGADAILEVSAFGWQLTQSHDTTVTQSYLGIPLPRPEASKPTNTADGSPSNYVLSIGTPAKYAPYEGYNFSDFLNAFADTVGTKFVLIGPDGSEPWWETLSETAKRQVEFRGMQNASAVRDALTSASCYVDSFPVSGGTMFGEALAAGLPVHGIYQPTGGYTYADSLRSETVKDLAQEVSATLLNKGNRDRQANVRQLLVEEQSFEGFCRRLLSAADGKREELPVALSQSPFDIFFFQKQFKSYGKLALSVPLYADVPLTQRIRLLAYFFQRRRTTQLHIGRRRLLRWLILGAR